MFLLSLWRVVRWEGPQPIGRGGASKESHEGVREATASLERSHDLETCLLKGNRTLQEQSVECEQPKEEYRWLREELNVTRDTVSLS